MIKLCYSRECNLTTAVMFSNNTRINNNMRIYHLHYKIIKNIFLKWCLYYTESGIQTFAELWIWLRTSWLVLLKHARHIIKFKSQLRALYFIFHFLPNPTRWGSTLQWEKLCLQSHTQTNRFLLPSQKPCVATALHHFINLTYSFCTINGFSSSL